MSEHVSALEVLADFCNSERIEFYLRELQHARRHDPEPGSNTDTMTSVAGEPELKCSVCQEHFSSPKILPCNHLACRDCVISWLMIGDQGGCPLCRVPILSPTHPGQGDLDSLVDALPSDYLTKSLVKGQQVLAGPDDFLTKSLIKGQQVLTGPDVCSMCPNDVAATSYCFECDQKLCCPCSRYHRRLGGTRDHSLQDLDTITAQDLWANCQWPCQNQDGRTAEVYCSARHQLICALCAQVHHRSCPEVKVLADVANEKRRELGHLVLTRTTKEAAMVRQIRARKDSYDQQWREVTKAFDGIYFEVKKRRKQLLDIIRMRKDKDRDLNNFHARTSLTCSLGRLLASGSDGVVVLMADHLLSRSGNMERCQEADDVQTVLLDRQRIADIKSALSALVAMASGTAASASTPTTRTTSTTTTTPKPTGPALARVLKVGDRVRLTDRSQRCLDPELEVRVQKLKAEEEEREYRRTTKNVDPVKQEIRFQEDVKNLNRQIIAVVNFVVTVGGAFAFGYKGMEVALGSTAFPIQMMTGLIFGMVVFFADLYFLLKYSPQ